VATIREPAVVMRAMRRHDLADVASIEVASYPFPWSRAIFADCLRVGYRCRLLELEQRIAAYAIVSSAIDEAHLLNLCVAPDFRRRGLARHLLEQMIIDLWHDHVARLFLEVRPSNAAALALYRQCGFRVIGRRPGYYPSDGGREDALILVCQLGFEPPFGASPEPARG